MVATDGHLLHAHSSIHGRHQSAIGHSAKHAAGVKVAHSISLRTPARQVMYLDAKAIPGGAAVL